MIGFSKRICGYLVLTLLCLACISPAFAHESRPAYLEVKETTRGVFDILWRTPLMSGMRLPVVLRLPDGLKDVRQPSTEEVADSLLERHKVNAGPNGLSRKRIEFPGLQATITDVLVRVEMLDGRNWTTIIRPSQPWVDISAAKTRWQIASSYNLYGIQHILFGIDHLLFVLGLVLIVGYGWMLFKTITAFTVAHSITLAVATFGYASAPLPPLNAAIALSILFLGPEIVRAWRGQTSLTIRYPWVVAFGFGLLHGFGFASGLKATGLPQADIPWALLFFNVGVEIGQVFFVFLVLAMAWSYRQLEVRWPRWALALPGYTVGSLGAFWTIQRTAILLGNIR